MKTETILSEEQLIQQAMDALISKLGVVETIRFLALKQQDKLDSIERHQQWQASLDKDQFFDQVFGKLD